MNRLVRESLAAFRANEIAFDGSRCSRRRGQRVPSARMSPGSVFPDHDRF